MLVAAATIETKFYFCPMEIKGKVLQLLPLTTGQGKKGAWKKQEFILETQSQYPKKVCLSLWGEKVDQYALKAGDLLSVSVDLESREYNGRWYTEARAWKIEKSGSAATDDVPFGGEPFVSEGDAKDDLPF
jgi:hypothetical protein